MTSLSTAYLLTAVPGMSEMVCPLLCFSQLEHRLGSPALSFSSCNPQGMTGHCCLLWGEEILKLL